MRAVAIVGAAGIQGSQIAQRLGANPEYELQLVETEDRQQRLRDRGLVPTSLQEAASSADAVILAVPDGAIKRVAAEVAPTLASGSLLMVLDAAAPFAAPLGDRDDVSYFIAHPCHPSVFGTHLTSTGTRDFAGGQVPQDVVCCLAAGEERAYALGEALARDMFAPVDRTHRITLEQFIILEPTLSETTAATLVEVIREAMDEAVALGVPAEVVRAFMHGHIGIELAIIFGELEVPFSVSADYAIEQGREALLKPDWKSVFEPANVRRVAEAIADGALPAHRRHGAGLEDAS
jgi:D-apionate oxidoisomerase